MYRVFVEPVPLSRVVELAIDDLQNSQRIANQPLARDFLYAAPRTQFPCEAPEDE